MFGLLREIRAACQYLQDRIAETLAGASVMASEARAAYVLTTLNAAIMGRVDQRITTQLSAIQSVFDVDATEIEWCADNVALIELKWSEIKSLWLAGNGTPENPEQRFNQLNRVLDQIVYQCASLSFSPRVNDILCNLRVGQPLDVEFEFGSEFPRDPDLRRRLVQELAQESAVIECGVVDPDQGVIYRVAATRREQVWSAFHLLFWLLFGITIPVILALGGRVLAGWPLKFADLERLLADYVLILVGSGAHLGVEALKTAKAKTRPSFQAINDWVLWLHVHESQTRNAIFCVWLGYILLAFGVPKLDWSSAFFAGYSIDSVTELFLERFQSVVRTKTQVPASPAK